MPGVCGRPRAAADFHPGVKLLFDENLAPDLVARLRDVFPESVHVRDLGLKSSPDPIVWKFAAEQGFIIVSKDADFRQRSFLYGHPPKVIWIRLGNCSTREIASLLRDRLTAIEAFAASEETSFLSLA
jgi:predicted nuclease of predicted toxin-antitoxin system